MGINATITQRVDDPSCPILLHLPKIAAGE
jgi:hypothetical protein